MRCDTPVLSAISRRVTKGFSSMISMISISPRSTVLSLPNPILTVTADGSTDSLIDRDMFDENNFGCPKKDFRKCSESEHVFII